MTTVACPNPACSRPFAADPTALVSSCPACGTSVPVVAATLPLPDVRPAVHPTLMLPDTDTDAGLGTDTARPGAAPGKVGRFEVRMELGEGAYGVVYRAYDPQLEREVALKVAKPAAVGTPERRERFLREAKAAANLRHPNIVPVFDSGRDGDRYYIASGFIDGRTLRDVVEDSGGKPRDVGWSVALVRRLAEALGYAHRKGIVHRDVKPDNVLIDTAGEPLLADFGLAGGRADTPRDAEERTRADALPAGTGTPAYMAPEQIVGTEGPAADQYSLGVVLFELLTGRLPFDGPAEVLLFHHLETPPPEPRAVRPGLSRDLEAVVLRCLRKDPAARYATCEDLAEDLRRSQAGEPVAARPLTWAERVAKWARRKPAAAAALAFAVVGVALAAAFTVAVRERQNAEVQRDRADAERANAEIQRDRADGERRGAEAARADEEAAKNRERAAKEAEQKALDELAHLSAINNVRSAYQNWSAGDVIQARALLAQSPPKARNWEWRYVNRLCSPELLTIPAHDGEVVAVGMNLDGNRIVSCGLDGTIKGWDAATGKHVYTIRYTPFRRTLFTDTGSHPISEVALSPHAEFVAARIEDGVVRVWDGETGAPRVTLPVGRGMTHIALDATTEPRLLTHSLFGDTILWNPEDGRILGRPAVFGEASFAPLKPRIASVGGFFGGWSCSVVDTRSGQTLYSRSREAGIFQDTSADHMRVRMNYPGGEFALFGGTREVELWDLDKSALRLKLVGHRDKVDAVGFNYHRDEVVTGGRDRTARVWDGKTGQQKVALLGHGLPVTAVAFNPGGKRVITGGADGLVKVWAPDAVPREVGWWFGSSGGGKGFDLGPKVLAVTPDGTGVMMSTGIAVFETEGPVKLLDTRTGKTRVKNLRVDVESYARVEFSRDGRWMATGAKGAGLSVLRLEDGAKAAVVAPELKKVSHFGFTSAGRLLALGEDRSVSVWDPATGERTGTFPAPPGGFTWLAVAPTGPAATVAADGTVTLWDPVTGAPQGGFPFPPAPNAKVSFTPHGTGLVVFSGDEVRVWEVAGRKLIGGLPPRSGSFAAASPDGRLLATLPTSKSRSVAVWDTASGTVRFNLFGHGDEVNSVSFSPDGTRIVTGSEDKTARLWDVRTGQEVLVLRGHTGGVSSARFAADGSRIVTWSFTLGNSDGSAMTWEAPFPTASP